MFPTNLDKVSAADLERACAERWPETGTLDFKRALPGRSDKDRHELLKDVCGLANAEGGDLVYGIAEADGVADVVSAIDSESADEAQRRLGQVLDSGLEPRVQGIRFHSVPVAGGFVLIVRVPASFDGPHRFLFNGQSKFVMRNGTHTTELSYPQLRAAFDRTATLTERARQFREARLGAIIEAKTWRRLIAGPQCVFHVIPLEAIAGRRSLDVQELHRRRYWEFAFSAEGGTDRSMNLDGVIVYTPPVRDLGIFGYTQVFRNGIVEAVRFAGSMIDERTKIPSTSVTLFYFNSIRKTLGELKACGYVGPAIVGVAMLRLQGCMFALADPFRAPARPESDRPDLVLQELWIDSLEAADEVDTALRRMMDVLWQGFGLENCYDLPGPR